MRCSAIFRLSVFRWIPSVSAAFDKLPSESASTREMNRRSNSRLASENRMPLSTISAMSRSSRSCTGYSSSRLVSNWKACTYFSRVFSMTSAGRLGTGGCLFQRIDSR